MTPDDINVKETVETTREMLKVPLVCWPFFFILSVFMTDSPDFTNNVFTVLFLITFWSYPVLYVISVFAANKLLTNAKYNKAVKVIMIPVVDVGISVLSFFMLLIFHHGRLD